MLANVVGNEHHRKKRNQRSKYQAIDKDDQPGFLEVGQLGRLDFAVHLRQRLFSAHRQHGMPKADKNRDHTGKVPELDAVQPTQGIGSKLQILRMRQRGKRGMPERNGVQAPANQDHDHYGRELHDAHGLLAGFRNALDVVPPEIDGDENCEHRGARARRNVQRDVNIIKRLVGQADNVLARGHAANRSG